MPAFFLKSTVRFFCFYVISQNKTKQKNYQESHPRLPFFKIDCEAVDNSTRFSAVAEALFNRHE